VLRTSDAHPGDDAALDGGLVDDGVHLGNDRLLHRLLGMGAVVLHVRLLRRLVVLWEPHTTTRHDTTHALSCAHYWQ
jgi:hypothetical protein